MYTDNDVNPSYGWFNLRSKSKKTSKSSDLIGVHQNFGLKGFTVGSTFEVWKK